MWYDLLVAFALLLVLEGVWPFLSPDSLRHALRLVTKQDNRSLRVTGLMSMVVGVVLLYVVN